MFYVVVVDGGGGAYDDNNDGGDCDDDGDFANNIFVRCEIRFTVSSLHNCLYNSTS